VRVYCAILCLAAVLALAGPAGAALPTGNIVVNGDAEGGAGATNVTDVFAPPAWDVLPNFTAVAYGTDDFPSTDVSAAIGGGSNFFAGGPDNGFGGSTAATQTIDLAGSAADLDGSDVTARLSADLGGFGSQTDFASISALFTNQDGSQVTGVTGLQPASPEDRGGVTGFVSRSACVALSPGTRTAVVQVFAQRDEGSYNDGYADNISVTLAAAPCPTLAPPTPPQPGVSGNAMPTRGRIFVRRPGSGGFEELTDERSIPVGSEINAARGEVQLETAADSSGSAQLGKFSGGKFVMRQKRTRKPVTDLVLTGGRLNRRTCGRAGRLAQAAGRRSGRRLFGSARGRFRTRGRHSTATVRGTAWLMKDSCNTTTVRVSRGVVVVRDLVKKRNIRLAAPRSYTARARPRR
jgi:hypothetical protein